MISEARSRSKFQYAKSENSEQSAHQAVWPGSLHFEGLSSTGSCSDDDQAEASLFANKIWASAWQSPVWTESLLCIQWVAKDPSFLHADSEDSDQIGRMPSLIWVFAGRTYHFLGFVVHWLKWERIGIPCHEKGEVWDMLAANVQISLCIPAGSSLSVCPFA